MIFPLIAIVVSNRQRLGGRGPYLHAESNIWILSTTMERKVQLTSPFCSSLNNHEPIWGKHKMNLGRSFELVQNHIQDLVWGSCHKKPLLSVGALDWSESAHFFILWIINEVWSVFTRWKAQWHQFWEKWASFVFNWADFLTRQQLAHGVSQYSGFVESSALARGHKGPNLVPQVKPNFLAEA